MKPAPAATMLTGGLLAIAGYLLPWFKVSPSYSWSFSGWGYAALSTGGGWTLWTLVGLGAAAVASLWARRPGGAAMVGVVAGVGGAVWAVAAVAASFSFLPERSSINYLAELPMGAGLPVLALGLGLLLAGGCRAIAVSAR